jgi:hypothetical protein
MIGKNGDCRARELKSLIECISNKKNDEKKTPCFYEVREKEADSK